MAKKLSASSRPEKFVRVSAERIFSKPITKTQRERLARLAQKPESAIDVSDIAPLTDEQARKWCRTGCERRRLLFLFASRTMSSRGLDRRGRAI